MKMRDFSIVEFSRIRAAWDKEHDLPSEATIDMFIEFMENWLDEH